MVWTEVLERYVEQDSAVSVGDFVVYGKIGPDYSVAIIDLDDDGEEVAHKALITPDGQIRKLPEA